MLTDAALPHDFGARALSVIDTIRMAKVNIQHPSVGIRAKRVPNVHAHGEVTLSDSARYETGEQHGRCGELHCEEIGEGARGDEGCSMYVPEFDLYTIYLLRTRRSHHGLDGSKGKTSIPTRAGQWMIG